MLTNLKISCVTFIVTVIFLVFLNSASANDRGQIIRRRKTTTAKPEVEQTPEENAKPVETKVGLRFSPSRRKHFSRPTEVKTETSSVSLENLKKPELLDLRVETQEEPASVPKRKKHKKRPEIQENLNVPEESVNFPETIVPNEEFMDLSLKKEPVPPLLAVEELKKIMLEVTPIQPDTELTDQYIPLDSSEVKIELPREPVTQKTVKIVENVKPEIPIPEESTERVITERMLFRSGVPLDYSYNETAESPDQIVSVPGCPKSIDGYPWVLYQMEGFSEPHCYLVGQRSSVCQGSSVMNYKKGSQFGVCACNFQECLLKRGLPLTWTQEEVLNGNQLKKRSGLQGKFRYRFCQPLGVTCEEFVYDQKENRCDILYSQAYCKNGEWLQRNYKGGVQCAPRLCEEGSGLNEKSEDFQRQFANVTQDNAQCCRSWGGFAVAGVLTQIGEVNCHAGQLWSDTLRKCIPPFKSSGLVVG